jgi:hypothetical protein
MKPVFVVWIETSKSAKYHKVLALLDNVVWFVTVDTAEDALKIVNDNVPGIFECQLNVKSLHDYITTDGVCVRMTVGEVY